ncbi:histidine phosphatase family protein [Cohnella ginsengisoli]|uniref:Histidine phosphatase family protein n=1 Tax=Cohnella ginsengisoli TaxID=425004 RepID=A0A9X4KGQ2_9BACL|nr:histidine phosphatase family protein [Cohnella ginsengisoli]MDG0791431.1 histidine phosphatase family protein [Cohnella ginsengisoli]
MKRSERFTAILALHSKTGNQAMRLKKRAVNQIEQILVQYAGKRIVLGTHGDILTLILNHFNREYDFDFWASTTMPDIYESVFEGTQFVQVTRKWG